MVCFKTYLYFGGDKMFTFFTAVIVLLAGFFVYSRVIEKVFQMDSSRTTPAYAQEDGIDYIPMKTWRVYLIQLLNIAGLGPIFGALMGAAWGPKVYLWIVFGTILGGGIHDYLSGMMSIRNKGGSISEISGNYLGNKIRTVMRIFSLMLLVLIGINFSVGPAALISKLTPEWMNVNFWLIVILVYYFSATFLPVDKIIGMFYPFFGLALIVMALGIAGAFIIHPNHTMPELTFDALMQPHPKELPVWAMMFVTVACGAISGFHATQSPIMARCIKNEKHGRTVFYGAMVTEGIIALIWAAAGVTFYENTGSLVNALSSIGPGAVVYEISTTMLGTVGGVLAMIGVIVCPITSGDTALRSARLTISDWFKIDQKSISKRLMIALPLLLITALGGQLPFEVMWRYFSWSNQVLAMIVLWTGAAYLYKNGFPRVASLMAALPATFMSAVVSTYILQAKEGLNISISIAYPAGIIFAAVCFGLYYYNIIYKK